MVNTDRSGNRHPSGMRASLVAVVVLAAGCGSSSPSPSTASMVPVTPPASAAQTPTTATFPPATRSFTPTPTAGPTPNTAGVPSRIVVTELDIDLPVIELANEYPPCGVAMFWPDPRLALPGRPGATWILAHARDGLFLPLLTASKVDDGKAMIGTNVDVYTTMNWVFTYTISAVHRHVPADLPEDAIAAAAGSELWLQTGEGPAGSTTILLIQATLTNASATSESAARPSPSPVVCP